MRLRRYRLSQFSRDTQTLYDIFRHKVGIIEAECFVRMKGSASDKERNWPLYFVNHEHHQSSP
jgi:hypothetical protein